QFTPPVAVNLLVTTKVANIRLEQTFGWSLLFMLTMFSSLLLVTVFPGIALWLPEYLGFAID
ncbi:MAG: TRAP transporter large permease subunit, partial [Alcaligenaceae bacterium]|nr:TRAP transporter large permease subunit [Alcaligenaceae bacterium]